LPPETRLPNATHCDRSSTKEVGPWRKRGLLGRIIAGLSARWDGAGAKTMAACSQCGFQTHEFSKFCSACGLPASIQQQRDPPSWPPPLSSNIPHHVVARGFAQTFGLHAAPALLTVIVNTMIFGGAGVAAIMTPVTVGGSLLALTAVSTVCGIILGIITYMSQKKWYDDDNEAAFIKALIVAFLTAIPVGLPGYLAIPAGIIGFFRRKD
jgi:ribosomal protein L37E